MQCLSLPQSARAVVNEHKDEVSNKKLINKSTQMCAQNPSRAICQPTCCARHIRGFPCPVFFMHISLSLFFISVCEPVHVCLWRERQRFAQCVRPDLAEIDLVYAFSRLPVDEMGIYNAPADGSDLAI